MQAEYRSFKLMEDQSKDQNKTNKIEPDEWEVDNLPNRLTLFRVLLIPVIIGLLVLKNSDWPLAQSWGKQIGYAAAWLFVLASITDFFDGYIARKRNIVTVLGSFLDPIADKFLVVSSLIMLQGLELIPTVLVIILVLREMYITALRLLAKERGLKLPVGALGKWKTAFQMIGIPMLMADDRPFSIPLDWIGIGFIYLAALFSIYSALEYSYNLQKKIRALKSKQRQNKNSSEASS
jgi:CDP-diacylglycerol--glycerol-3-phosphate 3-phosphatidyltransferase